MVQITIKISYYCSGSFHLVFFLENYFKFVRRLVYVGGLLLYSEQRTRLFDSYTWLVEFY